MPDNFELPDELKELLEEPEVKEKPVYRSDSNVENDEINILLNEGMDFKCPTKYSKYFGIKERTFNIKGHPMVVLVKLGREFKKLDFDRDLMQTLDILGEQAYLRGLLESHAPVFAKIIAIAVAGNKPFNDIRTWFYYHYFMERLTPQMMRSLAGVISAQNNLNDFFVSIISMSSQIRLTQPPSMIDNDQEG